MAGAIQTPREARAALAQARARARPRAPKHRTAAARRMRHAGRLSRTARGVAWQAAARSKPVRRRTRWLMTCTLPISPPCRPFHRHTHTCFLLGISQPNGTAADPRLSPVSPAPPRCAQPTPACARGVDEEWRPGVGLAAARSQRAAPDPARSCPRPPPTRTSALKKSLSALPTPSRGRGKQRRTRGARAPDGSARRAESRAREL